MIDFVGKRIWFIGLSVILVIVSGLLFLVGPGLNQGIDFTGGTSTSIQFDDVTIETDDVRSVFAEAGFADAIIQNTGEGNFFIRTSVQSESDQDDVEAALNRSYPGTAKRTEVTTVGKSVADDTISNAITAIVVAAVFIILFLFWAFRAVPSAYRYGLAAVIALAHDVILTLGLFVILGELINAEVNASFIVGTLTVIGYSVNDTIVVFDRIRENVRLGTGRSFRAVVNQSLNESIMRSLSTSFTTALVIVAMLLFGGETLRDFLLVLLAGVVVGTYSSIFIAAQALVFWEERGLFGRRKAVEAS
ncbi:MAG: protein translocase subunit SecF [Chloroflexi bacterium]|jgi:preprotein translocase subunit SecF|nr:protein translocase subunit SecF [Chloroflexota bacterium]MBT4074758.1 protein translocase subunit SecF [Chloroflexota bacterium]MBT4514909.1 protein translocase subunit SecF [Chloroflexota bacterium]MBT5319644.1 protein translocase subunit SecF [Chloroflexota bacterium]MBT6681911.1 protein translocase subunit SecF [Chloroflexota bacterium]